jgi:hypothetical protein
MAISRNRVGMAMDADAVVNPAVVRKIDGSFSRIYLRFNTGKLLCDLVNEETLLYFFLNAVSDRKDLNFHQNDNICTFHGTDMSLMLSIISGLTSRLLLSFCTLPDTSFFSDDLLFCSGETG